MRALFLLLRLLGALHCAGVTKADTGVASILCLEVFHNTREQCEMLLTQPAHTHAPQCAAQRSQQFSLL